MKKSDHQSDALSVVQSFIVAGVVGLIVVVAYVLYHVFWGRLS